MSVTDASTTVDVLAAVDPDALPVTRLHLFILLACALGFSFDLAEISFGSVLSAVFSAPPSRVDGTELSILLSAVYVGAAVGAPMLGWLADLYGRRLVMLGALAVLTVTSIGAALSPNIPTLIAFRGLSGLALGAYPPLMIAFMTDSFPAARRGQLVMFAVALGYLGPPALIFLVRTLIPLAPMGLDGWRWAFLICAFGAAVCAALFWFVPESARWLLRKGRAAEARQALAKFERSRAVLRGAAKTSGLTLVPDAQPAAMNRQEYLKRLLFLIVAYFLTPWASVGFVVLAGAVLVQKGINVQDSITYVGISTFAPIVGTFLAGFGIDRFERKTVLVAIALVMGLVGLAFGAVGMPAWLIVTGLLFNLLVTLFTPVLVLYASELFTTDRRAGATSWAWASSRVGSALTPLALLPLLQHEGPVAMFAVIAGTLVLFIVLVLMFGPRGEAGRSVA